MEIKIDSKLIIFKFLLIAARLIKIKCKNYFKWNENLIFFIILKI